jgi:hypothetical protein
VAESLHDGHDAHDDNALVLAEGQGASHGLTAAQRHHHQGLVGGEAVGQVGKTGVGGVDGVWELRAEEVEHGTQLGVVPPRTDGPAAYGQPRPATGRDEPLRPTISGTGRSSLSAAGSASSGPPRVPPIRNIVEIKGALREGTLVHFTAEQWKELLSGIEVGRAKPKYGTGLEAYPIPDGGVARWVISCACR